jgi:hypothetical protein
VHPNGVGVIGEGCGGCVVHVGIMPAAFTVLHT